MAEESGRSAAEREAARRERENHRASRSGRPAPYEQVADDFAAEPPVFERREPDPPAPDPSASVEPASAAPAPVEPPPVVAPRSASPVDPPPIDPDAAPLLASRDAPARPIKSFPSPPDPEFYVADDALDVPSGTRRVARGSGPRSGGSGRPPHRPRRPSVGRGSGGPARRSHRWRARIGALLVLAIAAAIVVFLIELYQPFGTSPHGSVTVRIPADTGASAVAHTLAHDGVISSSFFFELRATLDGDRGDIRAGIYHLRHGMSNEAVLKLITAVPKAAKTTDLTIDEGHTRQYVAALLKKQHVKGSYLAVTRHSSLLSPRSYGAPRSTDTLEGFLFPDTFSLVDPIRVSALVADQLRDFKRRFATVNLTQARRLGLNGFKVLTIASLIEAESASPADDRLVSSVIENRLRDHMMLQLDSTARYATGNFTGALTETQLRSRSPYNTHTHFGLPPGPIDSPGLTALNAAAHPASSHYLYFFSKPCTDQTVFATSYAQFQILLVRDHRSHCPK